MPLNKNLTQQISSLSVLELEELSGYIRSILRSQKKNEVVRTIILLAEDAGIEIQDIFAYQNSIPEEASKSSQIKNIENKKLYVHPDDPSLTWNGKGRHPLWFKSLIRNGVSPDSLIKPRKDDSI